MFVKNAEPDFDLDVDQLIEIESEMEVEMTQKVTKVATECRLQERVDPRLVLYLLDKIEEIFNDPFTPKEEGKSSVFKSLTKEKFAMNERGEKWVKYAVTFDKFPGRMYAENGVGAQFMPSELRSILFHDLLDIDVVNAIPSLLWNILKVNSIPCPKLEFYVTKREEVLAMFPTREIGKDTIIHVINGKKLGTNPLQFTKEIKAECEKTVPALISIYPQVVALVNKANKKRTGGTYLHHILAHYEAKVVQTAMKLAGRYKCKVVSNIFDGFLMRPSSAKNFDKDLLMRRMEEAVKEEHGLQIQFAHKEFRSDFVFPSEEELEKYDPLDVQKREIAAMCPGIKVLEYKRRGTYTCEMPCSTGKEAVVCQGIVRIEEKSGNVLAKCWCSQSRARLFGNTKSQKEPRVNWCPNVKVEESGEEWVKPYDFTESNLQIVKAGMMMGKSTQMMKTLGSTVKQGGKVLVIPVRVALGIGFRKSLDDMGVTMGHYKDNEFDPKSDVVICSFESLWKLPEDSKFDLIVLDEMVTLCNAMVSTTTSRDHLEENFGRLKAWVREHRNQRGHEPNVLVMDAGLENDGRVQDLFKTWFSSRGFKPAIGLTRYTENKMKRTLEFMTSDNFHQGILDNLDKKIAILCRSKSSADRMREFLLANGESDEKIAVFTSKGDDIERERVWSDPNKMLKSVNKLIFTSCIQAGIDITLKFDKIFVDASSMGGCSAMDLMQMIGRFRDTEDTTVCVLTGTTIPSVEWVNRFDQCVRDLRLHSNAVRVWGGDLAVTPEGLSFAPSDMAMLKAYSDAEQLDVFANMHRLAWAKGWDVFCEDEEEKEEEEKQSEISKQVCHAKSKAITVDMEETEQALSHLRDARFSEDYVDPMKDRTKAAKASAEDKRVLDLYHKLKHFPDLKHTIPTGQAIDLCRYEFDRVRRLAALIRGDDEIDRKVLAGKYVDLSAKMVGWRYCIDLLRELCELPTGSGPELLEKISQIPFSSNLPGNVEKKLKRLADFTGLKPRGKTVMPRLCAILKEFGIESESKQVRVGGRKKERRYTFFVKGEIRYWMEQSDFWLSPEEIREKFPSEGDEEFNPFGEDYEIDPFDTSNYCGAVVGEKRKFDGLEVFP